ncbi:sugar ABC transporter permease [Streptacidiphilus sp. PB12-B1b]|uniref:carbohydrate ABC transporter permease n=1 Tax=Streptacidiphilus TaxID=228398 RepID=UPI0009DD4704|nr:MULTISPECIES: sugar ABC transporter permease [Streptacidiphilus]QMU78430.1 sugar ABC transporter permease [Streptacidiphilus sp. PB12-B1b]
MSVHTTPRPTAVSRSRSTTSPPRSHAWRQRLGTSGFLLPALAVITVFYIVPNLLDFALAFTNWSTYSDAIRFTGLTNFRELLQQGALTNDLRVTVEYAAVVMVAQNLAGLALALALEKTSRANGFFRSVFFLPVLISPLAAGYVFKAILADNGPLNSLLGIHFSWLGSPTWTIIVVALVNAWKFMGINMLVYIAGLNAIPGELIEAAYVEGATWGQMVRRVKLPLLAPAVTFNVVATLIGAFNTFDIVFAMTQGGPGISTQVLNAFIQQEYAQGFYGLSIAMGLLLLVLVCVVAFPALIVLRRREENL